MLGFLQSIASSTSADPNSKAFASPVTLGSLIVVSIRSSGGNGSDTATVTDTQGNTYNLAVQEVNGSGTSLLYYAMNAAAGATTVTADLAISTACRMTLHEFSGVALAAALDSVSNTNGGSVASPISTGDITPTQADVLLFSVAGTTSDETFTGAGSGWTLGPTGSGRCAGAHRIVDAIAAYDADWAWSSGSAGIRVSIVAFLAEAGGGSPLINGSLAGHQRLLDGRLIS